MFQVCRSVLRSLCVSFCKTFNPKFEWSEHISGVIQVHRPFTMLGEQAARRSDRSDDWITIIVKGYNHVITMYFICNWQPQGIYLEMDLPYTHTLSLSLSLPLSLSFSLSLLSTSTYIKRFLLQVSTFTVGQSSGTNMGTIGLQSTSWIIYLTLVVGSLTESGEWLHEKCLQLHNYCIQYDWTVWAEVNISVSWRKENNIH